MLSGEATLDWSRVEAAPQVHLAVLLAGLDLVEHSEILGIETVPDSLADVVIHALSRSESQSRRRSDMQWRKARHMEDLALGYPGLRYVLLHSLAHALMHQLTLECGYTAASIRERIYTLSPEHEQGPMAGILLYTAAPDSEGTLGGLVGLGIPDQLGRHLDGALERTRSCTSDPSAPSTPAIKIPHCTKPPVTPASFYQKHPASAAINTWTGRSSSRQ